MIFEIYEGNRIVFKTEHKECMPTKEQLQCMKNSDKYKYSFKIDGKKVSIKELLK